MFKHLMAVPGEHSLSLPGKVGVLEAILTTPGATSESRVAILGHPHSLQGGTMSNKVVTTVARALRELNIPSLRFNFRGVGQSEGTYDQGIGESEDMIHIARLWQQEWPIQQFIFAGFSFGSYVVYRTAAQFPNSMLITIAPPVHHYDYHELSLAPSSWLIVQGVEDDVVPYSLVHEFAQQNPIPTSFIELTDAGHFFHGKLIELKAQLITYLHQQGIGL